MNLIIRTATMNDLQKIQELSLKSFEKEQKEFDSSLNLDWTFGKIGTKFYQDRITKEDCCTFVAVVDDNLVAYICGGLIESESYRTLSIVAELENIFVLEEYRSKRIGKQLYNQFLEWCKAKNVARIRVEASAQNELGIKFYRKNNFKDYTLVLEADL